jgi:hypothetical protein
MTVSALHEARVDRASRGAAGNSQSDPLTLGLSDPLTLGSQDNVKAAQPGRNQSSEAGMTRKHPLIHSIKTVTSLALLGAVVAGVLADVLHGPALAWQIIGVGIGAGAGLVGQINS